MTCLRHVKNVLNVFDHRSITLGSYYCYGATCSALGFAALRQRFSAAEVAVVHVACFTAVWHSEMLNGTVSNYYF